jgi:hypothetical protein
MLSKEKQKDWIRKQFRAGFSADQIKKSLEGKKDWDLELVDEISDKRNRKRFSAKIWKAVTIAFVTIIFFVLIFFTYPRNKDIDPNRVTAKFIDDNLEREYRPSTIEMERRPNSSTYEQRWNFSGKNFFSAVKFEENNRTKINEVFFLIQLRKNISNEREAKNLLKKYLIVEPKQISRVNCSKMEKNINNFKISFRCEKEWKGKMLGLTTGKIENDTVTYISLGGSKKYE